MPIEGSITYAGRALNVRVSHCARGERAVAHVDLPSGDPAGVLLRFSLYVELVASTAALVFPERVFVSMASTGALPALEGDGASSGSPRAAASAELLLTARAAGGGDVEVSCDLAGPGAPVRSKTLVRFAFASPPPPASCPSDLFLAEPAARRHALLYAPSPESPVEVPESLRVVSDAWQRALGRMTGCVGRHARIDFSSPLDACLAPAALEAAFHLSQWTWYALTGQRARPESIGALTSYRRPLGGEELRADVRLQGTRQGRPHFAATLFGSDRLPVFELRELVLSSERAAAEGSIRAEWQRFLHILRDPETVRP